MPKRKISWSRLENASKIFPSTCSEKDTKVFRLTCELNEEIQGPLLQTALEQTLENFPHFRSILRHGFFWYYLESSQIVPNVVEENLPLCSTLYYREYHNLLFRVLYYGSRIHFEIFHALSDGTGALWFLQGLVTHYLTLAHAELPKNLVKQTYFSSISQKMDDSFGKHFGGQKHRHPAPLKKKEKTVKAYAFRGLRTDENRMKLIEGTLSVQKALELSHRYNTTLTIYITALYLYSMYKVMPSRSRKYPVVLSIPINLRHYYESVTARNFFSTMHIGYDFSKEVVTFEDVIACVSERFKKELSPDNLERKLEQFMALEQNYAARLVPLPFKDTTLRLVSKFKDREISGSLSNIGAIKMPPELTPYIRQFGFCTSARRLQACMCSYGDRLTISFTSPYVDSEIEKTFFQTLSKEGIDIEIITNLS